MMVFSIKGYKRIRFGRWLLTYIDRLFFFRPTWSSSPNKEQFPIPESSPTPSHRPLVPSPVPLSSSRLSPRSPLLLSSLWLVRRGQRRKPAANSPLFSDPARRRLSLVTLFDLPFSSAITTCRIPSHPLLDKISVRVPTPGTTVSLPSATTPSSRTTMPSTAAATTTMKKRVGLRIRRPVAGKSRSSLFRTSRGGTSPSPSAKLVS
jgi:hypothetical protein